MIIRIYDMKRYLFFLLCLFLNFQSYGENEMEEIKNVLCGAVNPKPDIPSYLIWVYTSPIIDYNFTKLQFHPDSKVYFYYIRSYSNKSYIIMEGNGNYEVKNDIIKIYFETFSTVQNNEAENNRNVLEEKNFEVELEVELYNGGMLIRQIYGKKIFAEDDGNKIFDFKENWNYSLEQ